MWFRKTTICKRLALGWSLTMQAFICQAADNMLVTWGDYDVAPFVITHEGKLIGGIIKDIGDVLAKEMQLKPEYLQLPRKHMADMVLSGSVHMRIVFNPNWVQQPERYHWTPVLFEDTDILVIKSRDKQKFYEITDLNTAHIGTIMGHVYPDFEDYFHSQTMVRDNSINMDTNLIRLEKDRVNAVLTTRMAFDYSLTQYRGDGMFVDSNILKNANALSIMVSPHFPGPKEKLDQVVIRLKSSGKIAAILAKYR